MHYLIDGYNLLHAVGRLDSGPVPAAELGRARRWLVKHVDGKHPASDTITIVFDAQTAPRTLSPVERHGRVQVILALDDEADDEIERLIRAESVPQRLAVVSNDRRLLEAARRRAMPLRCDQYLDLLDRLSRHPKNRRPIAEKPDGADADEVASWLAAFGDSDVAIPSLPAKPNGRKRFRPAVDPHDFERIFLEWEESEP